MKDVIVVFSSNVDKWGAERSVCSMCDGLKKKGHDVLVIIPREGEIISILKELDIDYLVLPFTAWGYSGNVTKRFYRIVCWLTHEMFQTRHIVSEIKRLGYNPILVYSSTVLFGTGLYCAKKWKVGHIHHFRENIDAFGYKFCLGYNLTMSYIRKRTNHIICTCEAIKEHYIEYLGGTSITVVNNGVPLVSEIAPKSYDGKIRFVQVARFMDDKRIIDTLHAAKILCDRGVCNYGIDIYGRGMEEVLYRDYILKNKLSDYVHIRGFVPDIDFSPYHVGLMTSAFEAFARTTLDYMNNGLAVIASDSGGNLEQVVANETGLFFEVKNPQSLADKMEEMIKHSNLIYKFGKEGRKRFKEKFTQNKYQENILSVFDKYLR